MMIRKRRWALPFWLTAFLTMLVATACRPVSPATPHPASTAISVSLSAITIPGGVPDTTTPAGVVEAFYTWYLDPGRSGDIDDSPFLTPGQIEVAAARSGPFAADPFLLAQDRPVAIRVEPVTVEPRTAQVVLHQFWSVELDPDSGQDLTVDLVRYGDSWQIDAIRQGSPLTPRGVVRLFYDWYLGDSGAAGLTSYVLAAAGNPLADRTYRESPYLAPALVQRVDAFLEAVAAGSQTPYDPFLRARNHPRGFFIPGQSPEPVGNTAVVPIQLAYGREQVTIEAVLARPEGRWQLVDVRGDVPDAAASAAQVVALFADLYYERWYAYADAHDLPRVGESDLSGFVDASRDFYRESPLLSAAFAGADAAADPFFQAAGAPAMVEIGAAWADGRRAEVRVTQQWGGGREPRPVTVLLAHEENAWRISKVVVPAGAPDVTVTEPRAEMHPADVLRAFFADYMARGGYAAGAHRESPYLSPAYLQVLEGDVGYYRGAGVPVERIDPILHVAAAALAEGLHVEVGSVVMDEGRQVAWGAAARVFAGSDTALPLSILLVRDWDRQWSIQEIHPVALPAETAAGEELAEETRLGMSVAVLYDWAVAYEAQPEAVGRLPDLVGQGFAAEEDITFCDDRWPRGIAVEGAFIEESAPRGQRRALAVLRTTDPHTRLVLELQERGWVWEIVGQRCGDTPAGRALAFYTVYLGYPGDPTAARAYAAGDYLTADLVARIDAFHPGDGNDIDPLTLVADAVAWFELRSGALSNGAEMTLFFADGTLETVELTLVLVDGRWLISGVKEAE